jgi:hypothetical protein
VASIRKTLESVPHTLFETYDRILEYIDIEPYADLIRDVILITIHSWGPIDLEMMNEAISITKKENKLDRYYSFGNPKDILEICRGLICMHPSSTFEGGPDIGSTQGVVFSHYTVRVNPQESLSSTRSFTLMILYRNTLNPNISSSIQDSRNIPFRTRKTECPS